MGRVDDIHAAVRHVYQAALAPDEWQAALRSVASVIGAHKSMLNELTDGATGMVVSTGIEPDCVARLQREFESRIPDWISAIPVGTSLLQSSAISDADFRRSYIYNEAVRPAGGFYGVVAPLVRTPVRQVYFSAGRELGAADFSSEDVNAMNLIVPHLVNSLEVRSRLAVTNVQVQSALDVLACVNVGVILFDIALRPVFVNGCAEALASGGDGLLLRKGTVMATHHAQTQALQKAMARAVGLHDAQRMACESAIRHAAPVRCYLSREPPRLPLVVSVMPFCAQEKSAGWGDSREARTARGVLFVMEPDRPLSLDLGVLVETFQLTRREAQLAALLARGCDLAEAASKLAISMGTARGYLKQILTKTSTHRQAELVALVLRSSVQVVECAECVASR
ncbi:LuxR C-terminal-related transcriptional regulator [Paraburkholderia sp. FT54]|uniref:helix-turn-helix transcriptional regulator n=1 Tax=Paraburkholderia sp. FT54 TaxID=3074437 RepID=UPI0028772744|nr:LuxR C-terminal-related transcriptional regulator [Paraburkholderia sp. FT54]WNC88391.1 LuxR C-terminal-related transcriptional regulator [Paraburkholderia sp. FT54]